MKRKILLFGAGGHCKVILDVLLSSRKYEVSGIIDLKERIGSKISGVPVIGKDADLSRFFNSGIKDCFIAVGSVGDSRLRVKLYNIAKKLGFGFPNLISPYSLVSPHVVLGEGNYVAAGVIINAGTSVGNNCILNTGAIVEHDCKIGNFVHLSPGTILSGGVKIGHYSHVGTGSVVIQNINIGDNVVIGAGSVVTKDIRKAVIAYGNPCKERKENA